MRWFRRNQNDAGYKPTSAEWDHARRERDNAEELAQRHFLALIQEAERTKRYEAALRQIRLPRSSRVGKLTAPEVARRAIDGGE